MRKNNGFTLIELLATIIILAGIALVAFPILLNTIKNSENQIDGATQKLVINAAKLYVDNNLNNYPLIEGNTYCITFDDLIKSKQLEKGMIGAANFDYSNKVIKIAVTDNYNYEIEDIKNCKVKKMCTLVNDLNSDGLGYGDEYECNPGDGTTRTFYVLEIGAETTLTKGQTGLAGPDEVSLIMDSNINSSGESINSSDITDNGLIEWVSDSDYGCGDDENCTSKNDKGPLTAQKYLEDATSGWNVEVSMPTAHQIANASNFSDWEQNSTSDFMPDFEWLSTNLALESDDGNSSLRPYGYWTLTPSTYYDNYAWVFSFGPSLGIHYNYDFNSGIVRNNSDLGVRPVITISATQLSE